MLQLSRRVRFAVNPSAPDSGHDGRNSFAALPSIVGIGAHYEVEVICEGVPDSRTGYVINIAEIDAAVRRRAVPIIGRAFDDRSTAAPEHLLPCMIKAIASELEVTISAIRWWLSPYHCVSMSVDDTGHSVVTERFEFAAAHRLHAPDLSDEENRKIFGKCNHKSGHGHNYQVEVSVRAPVSDNGSECFSFVALEEIVAERIINRFDHKHLDEDVPEFRERNSTVENIARICFELLDEPIRDAGGTLSSVRVWETEKTSCTYSAD